MAKLQSYRILVEQDLFKDHQFHLNPKQSHYLKTVLRAKERQKITVFNGRDGEWGALINHLGRQMVDITVIEKIKEQPTASTRKVALCYAPIKGNRQKYAVEKAVEMGVNIIQPIVCKYSVISDINAHKTQEIINEATEQAGLLNIPELKKILPFSEALSYVLQTDVLLFCDEKHMAKFNLYKSQLPHTTQSITIFVGPEGGFSDDERDIIHKHHSKVLPFTLGPRILRADTAVIAALTLVQSYFEEWQIT